MSNIATRETGSSKESGAPETVSKDHSIHEPSTAHQHPLETIPQGSQDDGVEFGHDDRDVDTSILGKSVIGLFALIGFSFVVTYFVMNGMVNSISKTDRYPSASYGERVAAKDAWPVKIPEATLQSPDETPILLPDPEKPMIVLREQHDEKLQSDNWRTDQKGRRIGVTIPVERAMDLTLQRGLPTDNKTNPVIEEPSGEAASSGSIPPSETMMKREIQKGQTDGGKKREGATHD